ncbi:MAG: hypothetical protein NVSMB13_14770 [Mycobacteriales bacterium]
MDALYKDLRPDPGDKPKKNVYLKDLDEAMVEQVWERFLSALAPVHEAGKLGAILFQFPQWFPISRRNKHYIFECKRLCDPMRICVEFRNATWMSPENQDETLDFLRSYAVGVCSRRHAAGVRQLDPLVLAATADLAVVRFHGHNDEGWESGDIYQRFGYLYSEAELAEWVPKISALSEQAAITQVLMNNCYRNYAQVNAQQLADLLKGR